MSSQFNLEDLIWKYRKNTIGNGWRLWWLYKSGFTVDPYEMFSDKHILRTSYYLYNYMVMFGMAKGYLADIPAERFMEATRFYGTELKDNCLLEIQLDSKTDVSDNAKAIDKAFENLYNSEHGYTETFVSKMLMALWGHTIAWDVNFAKTTYRVFRDRCYTKRKIDDMEWSDTFKLLFDEHEQELSTLDPALRQLEPEALPIPKLRLIDMAYWQYGHDNP